MHHHAMMFVPVHSVNYFPGAVGRLTCCELNKVSGNHPIGIKYRHNIFGKLSNRRISLERCESVKRTPVAFFCPETSVMCNESDMQMRPAGWKELLRSNRERGRTNFLLIKSSKSASSFLPITPSTPGEGRARPNRKRRIIKPGSESRIIKSQRKRKFEN